jgi:hypothetical protein
MVTLRHTTLGKTPLDEWSDLYLTTHNTQETDIHAPGVIRAHNPSKRAAADQTLDRAATGNGHNSDYRLKIPVIQPRRPQPDMANPIWFCVECEDTYALHYQTPEQLNERHGQFRR